MQLAVVGVRSVELEWKIRAHLHRFAAYVEETHGHERLSTVVRRDVAGWRDQLHQALPDGRGLGPATVNLHLAHLRGFLTWLRAHDVDVLPDGDQARGVKGLPLPALEPGSLGERQGRSLKNGGDRLEGFRRLKARCHAAGRRRGEAAPVHRHARPLRDRAIVFCALSTGLRQAERVGLDLDQVEPARPEDLRAAKRALRRDRRPVPVASTRRDEDDHHVPRRPPVHTLVGAGRLTSRVAGPPRRQSGYSSLRQARASSTGAFGVRSSRNEWYGATNGSGAVTV